MRCDHCHGTGGVNRVVHQEGRIVVELTPCPECGGSGVAHCCEGAREQPDGESAECTK
jgi:DnaJ-class molecular chaperone